VPAAVYATRAVYAANVNKVYIFGGYNGSTVQSTTYVYDVAGLTWSTGAPLPAGRYFANEAYYPGNGKIYVIGGFDTAGVETTTTWEYVVSPGRPDSSTEVMLRWTSESCTPRSWLASASPTISYVAYFWTGSHAWHSKTSPSCERPPLT